MEFKVKTYSVTELHREISHFLEEKYLFPLKIEGEITSFRGKNSLGHFYFNLKDENSSISCVLFREKSKMISTVPEMGKKVKITGKLTTYTNQNSPSKYQIIVNEIEEISNIGELYKKYLDLREKLSAEGIFAEKNKKKEINKFPKCIGVVTSKSGEVIHDITKTIKERYPFVKIVLYPSKVQGNDAPKELIEGLKYMEKRKDIEVVIIGRGGGSFEDLFCFNDENLIRYIYSMKKPVISSVGHDKDNPICDLVADYRASTPTQAATILTPETFENIRYELKRTRINIVEIFKREIEKNLMDLDLIYDKIKNYFSTFINTKKLKIESYKKHISSLSFQSIINRGFSLTMTENGKILKDVNKIKSKERIKTILKNGEITSIISKINAKN